MQDTVDVRISNPVSQNIDVSITFGSDDSRWRFVPDHGHFTWLGRVEDHDGHHRPGPGVIDSTYPPENIGIDYLTLGRRYSIPKKVIVLDVQPPSSP